MSCCASGENGDGGETVISSVNRNVNGGGDLWNNWYFDDDYDVDRARGKENAKAIVIAVPLSHKNHKI